jgi:hypothetical protein
MTNLCNVDGNTRDGSYAVARNNDNVQVTAYSSSNIYTPVTFPFDLAVASGLVNGVTFINKFGRNPEIDAEVVADVWDGGATGIDSLLWVAPTQARIHAIVSTSTNDTSVGTGARTIRVWGLTDWDTKESSEDIALNGTTPVNTVNSYVIIHRIRVITNGGTINAGDITATAATDGTVTARLLTGEGQTQMCVYGVPSVQDLYLTQTYAALNRQSGGGARGYIDVVLQINQNPENSLTGFISKRTFGLSLDGTSLVSRDEYPVSKFDGPCIIKLHVTSATNNLDVSGGFGGYLIDNN